MRHKDLADGIGPARGSQSIRGLLGLECFPSERGVGGTQSRDAIETGDPQEQLRSRRLAAFAQRGNGLLEKMVAEREERFDVRVSIGRGVSLSDINADLLVEWRPPTLPSCCKIGSKSSQRPS